MIVCNVVLHVYKCYVSIMGKASHRHFFQIIVPLRMFTFQDYFDAKLKIESDICSDYS